MVIDCFTYMLESEQIDRAYEVWIILNHSVAGLSKICNIVLIQFLLRLHRIFTYVSTLDFFKNRFIKSRRVSCDILFLLDNFWLIFFWWNRFLEICIIIFIAAWIFDAFSIWFCNFCFLRNSSDHSKYSHVHLEWMEVIENLNFKLVGY